MCSALRYSHTLCRGRISGWVVEPTCVWIPRYSSQERSQAVGLRCSTCAAMADINPAGGDRSIVGEAGETESPWNDRWKELGRKGLVECGVGGGFQRLSLARLLRSDDVSSHTPRANMVNTSILGSTSIVRSIEWSVRDKVEVFRFHAFRVNWVSLSLSLGLGVSAMVCFVLSSVVVSATSQRLA